MAVSFLKTGKEAQEEVKKQDELDAEKSNLPLFKKRFWLPKGAENQITFLTGALDDDGILDTPMYYEHQVNLNGSWKNWFICTGHDEPCPICEGGDNPALVGVFQVIDHSEWTDKKDIVHKDELKLMVAKRDTLKLLQKIATKRGGLVGLKFDVEREDEDTSPNVGSTFECVGKSALSTLVKKYKLGKIEPFEDVLTYLPAKELVELGFGSYSMGAGSAEPSDDQESPDKPEGGKKDGSKKASYTDQL